MEFRDKVGRLINLLIGNSKTRKHIFRSKQITELLREIATEVEQAQTMVVTVTHGTSVLLHGVLATDAIIRDGKITIVEENGEETTHSIHSGLDVTITSY